MPDPAQTPGAWMFSPGAGGNSAACRAAMMACGVDPDGFGSYSGIKKSIKEARDEYSGDHRTAAALNQRGPDNFSRANSQSGHMAQNACFQAAGGRGDPCANVAPNPPGANNASPSSYGYTMAGAPSTYHAGSSTNAGTMHGTISIQVERGWQGTPGSPLTEDQIAAQVQASAQVQADANRDQPTEPSARKRSQVENLQNAQQQNAARMARDNPEAAKLAGVSPASEGSPAGASGPGPSDETKAMAAECITAKWKAAMAEFRANAVNSSAVGQSTAAQDACKAAGQQEPYRFTDLPADKQQEVVRQCQQDGTIGSPPPGSPPQGVPSPPDTGRAGKPPPTPPTKESCLGYQQNYLACQTAANGGTPPGWAGRVPGATRPASPTPDGASTGGAAVGF